MSPEWNLRLRKHLKWLHRNANMCSLRCWSSPSIQRSSLLTLDSGHPLHPLLLCWKHRLSSQGKLHLGFISSYKDQPRQHIKKQRHYFAKKGLVKAMVFPRVMYGCESWTIKKAECRRIDVFELWCWQRLESPLDCKEIQPVHPKDQSWVFTGRTDAEAETPILWPPHMESWLIGKDPDAGREWGQEEKGSTEDEMAGWHHWLDGHEFEWTLGVGDGQGGLVSCSSWGRKESDTTEWLNWTENWI